MVGYILKKSFVDIIRPVSTKVFSLTLDMSFNIRNTSDKGSAADPDRVYPDKLQSGYKMKGESIETVFND